MPTVAEVFREFNVEGNAGSGKYQPEKPEIIAWGEDIEAALVALADKDEEQDTRLDAVDATLSTFVQDIVDLFWPVDSLYITRNGSVPATLAQDRTWVVEAAGRALVGVGSADGVSYAGGQMRGAATHTLTSSQIPVHTHSRSGLSVNIGNGGNDWRFDIWRGETGSTLIRNTQGLSIDDNGGIDMPYADFGTGNNGTRVSHDATHGHSGSISGSLGNTGGDASHNNIQPSIGVYVFRRTA